MFDKQDAFNFHIDRMPSSASSIASIIIDLSIMSEFAGIAGQHCY